MATRGRQCFFCVISWLYTHWNFIDSIPLAYRNRPASVPHREKRLVTEPFLFGPVFHCGRVGSVKLKRVWVFGNASCYIGHSLSSFRQSMCRTLVSPCISTSQMVVTQLGLVPLLALYTLHGYWSGTAGILGKGNTTRVVFGLVPVGSGKAPYSLHLTSTGYDPHWHPESFEW